MGTLFHASFSSPFMHPSCVSHGMNTNAASYPCMNSCFRRWPDLSLLHRNHMSASLDCLYLVPFKSALLLSPSRTPLDSSQSHKSKLTRSQLCWQGTEAHEPINNDSLYSNSHRPLAQTGPQEWRPPSKPNVAFSRLARSIRETLTRAARFITSPSVWSVFNLHRPSNTRT